MQTPFGALALGASSPLSPPADRIGAVQRAPSADRSVRVYAVAPIYLSTPLNAYADGENAIGRRWIDGAPMDRSGAPEEVASVILVATTVPSTRRVEPASTAAKYMPGREADSRVARIAFRLAAAGLARCPRAAPDLGWVLQHLSQFSLADRPGTLATLSLGRGPGVIAIVPGGPADAGGVRAGDVLLAIDGDPLPPEPGLTEPFAAPRAHARADAVADLLARPETRSLTLLRDGVSVTVQVQPVPICPSQVHLARSDQRNAFADGRHVFLTTGLLGRLSNDDELAFVIAHELAHNILGHAVILRAAKADHQTNRTQLVRRTEDDADRLAGELLLDAGFDPVAGAQALTRLGGGDLGIDLSAEHQSDTDRVEAMRALVAARRAR